MQRQETERGECMKEYMTENLKSIFEAPYDTFEIIMAMVNLEYFINYSESSVINNLKWSLMMLSTGCSVQKS